MRKQSRKRLVIPTTPFHGPKSEKEQMCYRVAPQNNSKSPTEIKSTPPPKRKNAVKYPEDMRC